MIRGKLYDAEARRPLRLHLEGLGKTDAEIAAYRKYYGTRKYEALVKAIADDDLSVGQVLELFSDAEIRAAAHRRLAQVAPHSNEYKELTRLVQDPAAWRSAQGGDQNFRDRFGVKRGDVPRGSRTDTFGAGASRGDNGDIAKSLQAREQSRALAKSAGYRMQQMVGETQHLFHPARPGDLLVISGDGSWERERRGMAAERGDADTLSRCLGLH